MKQILKIFLGLFVVVLLLVGGGLYYVYTNLDSLVERGIETAGTSAAGSAGEVDGVDLDLVGGSATIRGFTVANPAGFSNADMLRFDELAVVIDVASITSTGMRIISVSARNPHLLYETHDGSSNVDAMRQRVSSGEPAPESAGSPFNTDIGRIDIEGIGATVSSDLMPNPVEVNIGDIHLQNLSGTPNELAQQVLRQLLTQLAAASAKVALTFVPEDLRAAGAAVRDAAAARAGQAQEAAGAAVGDLRNRVGNLLNRDADEQDADDAEDTGDASPANQ